mmetsp:Transcript_84472/g.244196  ORF Transcript_84472/g.244196 Transcript_84472/m.244196 type:complete len:204 (-) Transcript_84472:434-1045(-)
MDFAAPGLIVVVGLNLPRVEVLRHRGIVAKNHLGEHQAQRPHGVRVTCRNTADHLRRVAVHGAHEVTGTVAGVAASMASIAIVVEARAAEVGDECAPVFNQNVCRRQVIVQHACVLEVLGAPEHVDKKLQAQPVGQPGLPEDRSLHRLLRLQELLEAAVHRGEEEEGGVLERLIVVERDDVAGAGELQVLHHGQALPDVELAA